ncbi:MAG TPA: hypothetical protein VKK79_05795 [Candidatus Lokiarchaeia archaeon]|nr:hypothetical protein [Candidatus Lokiarchaeia archaeon]
MGGWALSTVLLESDPVARFTNIGQYLNYAGISNGKEQFVEVQNDNSQPYKLNNHFSILPQ